MKQGLYGWFNKNLRGKKGQQGFTLIELLVVVTILGVLAAIVTLSLVGLTTNASVQSCNAEYKTVQSALDAYMANNNLAVLPAQQLVFTNDMTGNLPNPPGGKTGTVPLYNPNPSGGSPNYTRNGTTQFFYTWDQFGRITAIGSTAGGAAVTGCAPK
jgi:prepilin-type N-terminal cleavage/methylation domain-containing protein